MIDWQVVWLGVMAIALAIMALIQIGLIIAAIKVAAPNTSSARS